MSLNQHSAMKSLITIVNEHHRIGQNSAMPDESSQPQISYKKNLPCAICHGFDLCEDARRRTPFTRLDVIFDTQQPFYAISVSVAQTLRQSRTVAGVEDVAGFSHVFVMQRLHSWISDVSAWPPVTLKRSLSEGLTVTTGCDVAVVRNLY
ncbi:hypothetical protein HBI38_061500 [Parastagonospora nodorum]|nr:hypothetical protein HBH67_194140 [Parastagonospora nodorum]KAH6325515.1 hypothetical protein HBI38_061500 [Parastagonospora nodorum]